MKRIVKLAAITMLSLSTVTVAENIIQPNYSQASSTIKKSKVKKYNKVLLDSLAEDQGFANKDDGQNYLWATYVDRVTIDRDKTLTVYITDDAMNLTKTDQKEIGHRAEKMATATLMTEGAISDQETIDGLFTVIKHGSDIVGRSKVMDNYEFKMKK